MLHLDHDKVERRFTFEDMSRASGRAANYFKALGIKRGDRVMLVLKRHYQFWFAILGLHKLGAVAVPATNQLRARSYLLRYTGYSSSKLCHPSREPPAMIFSRSRPVRRGGHPAHVRQI